MMDPDLIRKVRSKAVRCRELASAASDAEAAQSLLQIAGDIETVLSSIETHDSEASRFVAFHDDC